MQTDGRQTKSLAQGNKSSWQLLFLLVLSEGPELATHFSPFNTVDVGSSHTAPIIQMKKLGQRAVI